MAKLKLLLCVLVIRRAGWWFIGWIDLSRRRFKDGGLPAGWFVCCGWWGGKQRKGSFVVVGRM